MPAPDGSGALVVALDLHHHHAVVEHSDGRAYHIPLAPDRSVGAVTREVLAAVGDLVGPVPFDPTPQETPWTTPLDEDVEHTTYNPTQVNGYFAAATHAALVLAAVRAPYRGRSTPVNAWWGTFDLAVSLFSGEPVDPPRRDFITRNSANAQQIEVGWWPGDARYPFAAFFAFAFPAAEGLETATLSTPGAHWEVGTGGVRPQLGRRVCRARSLPCRRGLRAFRDPPRLRGVRLGSGSRRECRWDPTSGHLSKGASSADAGDASPKPLSRVMSGGLDEQGARGRVDAVRRSGASTWSRCPSPEHWPSKKGRLEMSTFLAEIRETLAPGRSAPFGPLRPSS